MSALYYISSASSLVVVRHRTVTRKSMLRTISATYARAPYEKENTSSVDVGVWYVRTSENIMTLLPCWRLKVNKLSLCTHARRYGVSKIAMRVNCARATWYIQMMQLEHTDMQRDASFHRTAHAFFKNAVCSCRARYKSFLPTSLPTLQLSPFTACQGTKSCRGTCALHCQGTWLHNSVFKEDITS